MASILACKKYLPLFFNQNEAKFGTSRKSNLKKNELSKSNFLSSLKIQRNLKQDKIILAFGEKFELFLQIFDWVTPSIVIFQKSYKANFSSQDFKSKHFSLFRKVTFCQLWIADNKKFWEAWNLKLFFCSNLL